MPINATTKWFIIEHLGSRDNTVNKLIFLRYADPLSVLIFVLKGTNRFGRNKLNHIKTKNISPVIKISATIKTATRIICDMIIFNCFILKRQ